VDVSNICITGGLSFQHAVHQFQINDNACILV
jgi:hypothetical protein